MWKVLWTGVRLSSSPPKNETLGTGLICLTFIIFCGYNLVVECHASDLIARVRFPLPAPFEDNLQIICKLFIFCVKNPRPHWHPLASRRKKSQLPKGIICNLRNIMER